MTMPCTPPVHCSRAWYLRSCGIATPSAKVASARYRPSRRSAGRPKRKPATKHTAAAAVCFVAGFLFGLPALRLEGLYLALATFALGVAMPQLLKYHALEKWTGGVQGIVIAKPPAPFGLPLNPDQWLYFFT